jgi:hypothetical protein
MLNDDEVILPAPLVFRDRSFPVEFPVVPTSIDSDFHTGTIGSSYHTKTMMWFSTPCNVDLFTTVKN